MSRQDSRQKITQTPPKTKKGREHSRPFFVLAPCTAGRYQLPCVGISHLLQTGKYLYPIHQYGQFTLFGTTLNRNLGPLNIFLYLSGKTCRQLLLASRGTVLNQYLHDLNSFLTVYVGVTM